MKCPSHLKFERAFIFLYIKNPTRWKTIEKMVVVLMKKRILKTLIKKLNPEPHFREKSNEDEIELKKQKISSNLDQNLETFKALYSVPKNLRCES